MRIVVPLILLPFGIDLGVRLTEFGQFRKGIEQLDFATYVIIWGVLIWGLGMALSLLIMSYVRWRYLGEGPFAPIRDLVFGLFFWGTAGAVAAVARRRSSGS
jgi:hypothetical protein